MIGLVGFLRERLDEDEHAVRAAINPECPGTRWQWISPSDDTPAKPDDDGYLRGASLRTVEHFPTRLFEEHPEWASDGKGHLPDFAIYTVEEMRESVGVHIARHDPERVLAEVEAKRRMLAECEVTIQQDLSVGLAETLLSLLAAPYADHPHYKEEWRP